MNTETDREKRDTDRSVPKHISYKLRMDLDNVESTLMLQPRYKPFLPVSSL